MQDVLPDSSSTPSPESARVTPGASTIPATNAIKSSDIVPGSIDLAQVVPPALLVVIPESEDERRHRLNEKAKDAEEKRLQSRVALALMTLTYVLLFIFSAYWALHGNTEQQKWALSGLSAILGSALGFLAGRKN